MKLKEYLKTNTDRFACRWMIKRDPSLWSDILRMTAFLPDDALPKQRCWHVENDIYEIPLCPTTGSKVKWFENRYLTYSSLSAKSSAPEIQKKMRETYEKRNGHSGHWSSAPEVREKRRAAMMERVADPDWTPTCGVKWTQERRENVDRIWKEKRAEEYKLYGDDFKLYRKRVDITTRRTFREHKDKILDSHKHRGHFSHHLDHVYSVYDGWKNKVEPEVISHWSNLRMIPYDENVRKNSKSHKSLEQLMEDYQNSLNS